MVFLCMECQSPARNFAHPGHCWGKLTPGQSSSSSHYCCTSTWWNRFLGGALFGVEHTKKKRVLFIMFHLQEKALNTFHFRAQQANSEPGTWWVTGVLIPLFSSLFPSWGIRCVGSYTEGEQRFDKHRAKYITETFKWLCWGSNFMVCSVPDFNLSAKNQRHIIMKSLKSFLNTERERNAVQNTAKNKRAKVSK